MDTAQAKWVQKPRTQTLDDERVVPGRSDPATYQSHLARYHFALGLLYGGERVLDAACGSGYGVALLCAKSSTVVGVDYSALALAYARGNFARPNLTFAAMDCHALALDAESFDTVVSFEVFEHLEESERFLDECRRVLRPGGRLLLSTPNRATWDIHMASIDQEYEFHVNMVDLDGLRRQLSAFFPLVEIYGQRRRGSALYCVLRALDPFNLRLRLLRPVQREKAQRAFGVLSGLRCEGRDWVFGRTQLRQANHFLAICRKAR